MTDTERRMYNFVVEVLERDYDFVRLLEEDQVEIARQVTDECLRTIASWKG